MCVVDEAEIERGRGRKNVNSLRKLEASCTYFFAKWKYVHNICASIFLRGSIFIEKNKHK